MSGRLVVCPTPIGNLADITLRTLEMLRAADVIACEDTRRTRTLLTAHDVATPLVSVHQHNERARSAELVERIAAGQTVALVSDAGTPLISDPGARLIDAVVAAGGDVDVLPGPSAVVVAAALSGFADDGFCFGGFLSRSASARTTALDRLDRAGVAVVLFESPNRLGGLLAAVAERRGDRRVVVCRELTKLHQEVVRGTAAECAERFAQPTRGEVTVVLEALPSERPAVDPEALAELASAVGAARAAELGARLTGAPRNALYRTITSR